MVRVEPAPISVKDSIAKLTFLPDRTPTTSAPDAQNAFALLCDYRDGGIFVGHWAGNSEWERHDAGDEIVMVLEGRTTIFFFARKRTGRPIWWLVSSSSCRRARGIASRRPMA